jgi:hypothetical protein
MDCRCDQGMHLQGDNDFKVSHLIAKKEEHWPRRLPRHECPSELFLDDNYFQITAKN